MSVSRFQRPLRNTSGLPLPSRPRPSRVPLAVAVDRTTRGARNGSLVETGEVLQGSENNRIM